MELALSAGERVAAAKAGKKTKDDDGKKFERKRGDAWAEVDGYNLHVGAKIAADDRETLEHLVKYMLRPAICLERLKRIDDDTLTYELRRPDKHGRTHVLTAMQLIARVVALVPAAGCALVKY